MSKKPTGKNPLAKAAQAERNRKIFIQVGVAVVLIGLIAAIGITLALRHSDDNKNKPSAASTSFAPVVKHDASAGAIPPNVTAGGAIRVGDPNSPAPGGKKKVTVQIVADMQCPICATFEKANSDALTKAATDGSAVVEYNVISFLDRMSKGNKFSTRAANAAYVVGSADPAKFQGWLAAMFAQQPAENGNGMTDDQLIKIAADAGYTDPAIAQDIRDGKYLKYVADETQATFDAGVQGTPAVYVNGTQIQDSRVLMTPGGITSAIDNAAK
ncbi:thioredoxin domain-containing protein [Nocardia sp. CDC153]|uniref:DsbA family protein n=1 Tax=Nocardia sp. CDC153 TaxID=3112167 RepID=UPI002DBFFAAA|nr:thioredoxin domain-containing protein [Nocardia sp. CDC153]MEC3951466.1 thioredoxin domain-containing protein [Nocardia sp. CDC153]